MYPVFPYTMNKNSPGDVILFGTKRKSVTWNAYTFTIFPTLADTEPKIYAVAIVCKQHKVYKQLSKVDNLPHKLAKKHVQLCDIRKKREWKVEVEEQYYSYTNHKREIAQYG